MALKVPGRRWAWPLAVLLALLVVWGWWSGSAGVRDARKELAALEARRQVLEHDNRQLERQVTALKREREAKARAAREALDLAAPGEILVVIPQPTPAPIPR